MSTPTEKISTRLKGHVCATLEAEARDEAVTLDALIQRILTDHAAEYARRCGLMATADIDRLELEQSILATAVRRARELNENGVFDEHFTLTVIRDLMSDPAFRADYEKAIGGDAYQNGLPGKFQLNMHLGRYIKNAIPDAVPLLDSNRKPRRMQVRDEPIRSYTLLTKS